MKKEKRMGRSLLSWLLVVAMTIAFVPGFGVLGSPAGESAYADETDSAESFRTALTTGGSVTLAEDIVLNENILIPEGIDSTVDLNGKNVQLNGGLRIRGKLTIKDSTADPEEDGSGGRFLVESNINTISEAYSWNNVTGTLSLESGTLRIHNGGSTESRLYVSGSGVINLSGGTLEVVKEEGDSDYVYGIYMFGGSVNQTGGTLYAHTNNGLGVVAAYLGGTNVYNLSGGTVLSVMESNTRFSNANGIEMRRGRFVMTGGTVEARGTNYEADALYINTTGSTYEYTVEAIVSGGKLIASCNNPGRTANWALRAGAYGGRAATHIDIVITGGEFSGMMFASTAEQNDSELTISGGDFTDVSSLRTGDSGSKTVITGGIWSQEVSAKVLEYTPADGDYAVSTDEKGQVVVQPKGSSEDEATEVKYSTSVDSAGVAAYKYTTLSKAISEVAEAENGGDIVLLTNITLAEGVELSNANTTLDMNGFTVLDGSEDGSGALKISGGKVKGELRGSLLASGGYFEKDPSAVLSEGYGAVQDGEGDFSYRVAKGVRLTLRAFDLLTERELGTKVYNLAEGQKLEIEAPAYDEKRVYGWSDAPSNGSVKRAYTAGDTDEELTISYASLLSGIAATIGVPKTNQPIDKDLNEVLFTATGIYRAANLSDDFTVSWSKMTGEGAANFRELTEEELDGNAEAGTVYRITLSLSDAAVDRGYITLGPQYGTGSKNVRLDQVYIDELSALNATIDGVSANIVSSGRNGGNIGDVALQYTLPATAENNALYIVHEGIGGSAEDLTADTPVSVELSKLATGEDDTPRTKSFTGWTAKKINADGTMTEITAESLSEWNETETGASFKTPDFDLLLTAHYADRVGYVDISLNAPDISSESEGSTYAELGAGTRPEEQEEIQSEKQSAKLEYSEPLKASDGKWTRTATVTLAAPYAGFFDEPDVRINGERIQKAAGGSDGYSFGGDGSLVVKKSYEVNGKLSVTILQVDAGAFSTILGAETKEAEYGDSITIKASELPKIDGERFITFMSSNEAPEEALSEITLSDLRESASLAAIYLPVVTKVEFEIAAPSRGNALDDELDAAHITLGNVYDVVEPENAFDTSWHLNGEKVEEPASKTAERGESYTVVLTLKSVPSVLKRGDVIYDLSESGLTNESFAIDFTEDGETAYYVNGEKASISTVSMPFSYVDAEGNTISDTMDVPTITYAFPTLPKNSGSSAKAAGSSTLAVDVGSEPEEAEAQSEAGSAAAEKYAGFSDLNPEGWYREVVLWALENDIMNGVSEGVFAPSDATGRAMVVTMLYRLNEKAEAAGLAPALEGEIADFDDVPAGKWYTAAVSWAAVSGLVSGYPDGSFDPAGVVSREQLANMLYRYAVALGLDVSVGEDTNILSYGDIEELGHWATPAMQWACGAGIIQGSDEGLLLPKAEASRAQVAAMLMRFSELFQ